jgi:hypothetical protein
MAEISPATRASKLVNRKKICHQGSFVRTFAPYLSETRDVIVENLFARRCLVTPSDGSSARRRAFSC